MLYLQKDAESQSIWVPKSFSVPGLSFLMVFHSTVGLEDVIVPVRDSGAFDNYLVITLTDDDMASLTVGEWEYTIMTGDSVPVASGVVEIIGDDPIAYRKEYAKNVSYEQYRTDL